MKRLLVSAGACLRSLTTYVGRARRKPVKRLALVVGVLMGTGGALLGPATINAATKTTVNVAYVFDEPFTSYSGCLPETAMGVSDARGPGCGASIFVNALTGLPLTSPGAYTTADTTKVATFTNVPVSSVDA